MGDLTRIEDISDDDLRKELERREAEEKKQAIPRAIESPDLLDLKRICREYIDDLAEDGGYAHTDHEHYVFEVAMKTFFGQNVFEWIRAQLK